MSKCAENRPPHRKPSSTPPNSSAEPPSAVLSQLRARPLAVVALFMALSLSTWLLPLCFAAVILLAAMSGGLFLGMRKPTERGKLKVYGLFILFWGLSTFLLQWWAAPVNAAQALGNAWDLSLRLAALAALTLDLSLLLTPFALAVVLARLLRPLLGSQRAGQAGLALAVMLRLLPQAWQIIRQIRQTQKLRCRRLSWVRQSGLLAGAVLRRLSTMTWQQSLALAGRDIQLLPANVKEDG